MQVTNNNISEHEPPQIKPPTQIYLINNNTSELIN